MRTLRFYGLCLLSVLFSTTAWAYDFEVDGIFYNIKSTENQEVEVTYGNWDPDSPLRENEGYAGDIVLPATVQFQNKVYKVTTIGNKAFCRCPGLTAIDFKNVNTIGEWAFFRCDSLTTIDFKNVKTIGNSAFNECKGLIAIDLKNVKTIGNSAFVCCKGLTTIDFKNVVTIGREGFNKCTGLTTIDFKNVNTIGEWAFNYCTGLTTIDFENVTTIGNQAFQDCDGLVLIDFKNVETIGNFAFQNCMGLVLIDLRNVTTIGKHAFYYCDQLKNVIAPINIPDTPYDIFNNSPSIYVPPFSLDAYKADTHWKNYKLFVYDIYQDGILYQINSLEKQTATYFRDFAPTSKEKIIPISVNFKGKIYEINSIGDSAFSENTNLTSIEIGKVTSIENLAFYGCTALTSIDLRNVTNIASNVFRDCTALSSIDLRNVRQIGISAFENCKKLTSIELNNITFLGQYAFRDCPRLNKAYLPQEKPLQYGSFPSGINILVPSGSLNAYRGWSDYHLIEYDYTEGGRDYKIISEAEATAALVCPAIDFRAVDFKMPEVSSYNGKIYNITEIGNAVFKDCRELTSFDANKVKVIRKSAFEGCEQLDSITLLNVETIEDGAFKACPNLKTIQVHTAVPPVVKAESAFEKNVYLTAIVYVPMGCQKAYEEAPYWKNFQIQESVDIVMGQCSLSVSKNEGGKVQVNDSILYEKDFVMDTENGQQVTITLTPDTNYAVASVLVNGTDMAAQLVDNALTLTMDKDKTVVVTFQRLALHLNDATDTYADSIAVDLKELTYTRNFANTEWQTLYLPFALDAEDWLVNFDIAELNDVHQFDVDNDGFYERTDLEILCLKNGKLKANRPYLIRAKTTGEYTFKLKNVRLEAAAANSIDCSSVRYLYAFKGTYQGLGSEEVSTNHIYTLGDNGLIEENGNAVGAFRWYLTITSRDSQTTTLPKSIRLVESEELTGIENASFADAQRGNIYDLNGRLVKSNAADTEGLQPGIYLMNDKKVMVR